MRQTGRKGYARALSIALVAAMVIALAAPAIAAAAVRRPTLVLSSTLMATAKPVTISGAMGTAYRGRTITILMRKPGRTYWTELATTTVNAAGRYAYRYTPKLGGKFYVRTRYGATSAGLSRLASFTVRRGPGVKTQILLSSTTSTKDSGLFERIGPAFLAACPEYTLKAEFVGSGTAMAHGGSGDADVLLTHSPAAEVDFMKGIVAGTPVPYRGKTRYKVMYNDFVMVGPNANPAAVLTTDTAVVAFGKVASSTATFWSRNDNSGTNAKEKSIWALLGNPQTGQDWYKASGTMGMAQALAASNDAATSGYTLADRGTWLMAKSLGTVPNLKIVNEGDSRYFNQYAVIEVMGARNWEGAQDFSNWIRSPQAQELIRTYGEYTYTGQAPMFVPNAGPYPW